VKRLLERSIQVRPLAAGLLLLVLLVGCNRTSPTQRETDESPTGPPAVTLVKPAHKTLVRKIEQPGEIEAFERTPVFARVSGYVLSVNKDIGDRVKKDEVLAELTVPEMDEELNQKKALVAQAGAKVEQANKLYEAAEANLQSAGARVKEAESSRLRVNAERRRASSQYARLRASSSVVAGENVEEARLGAEAARAAVAEVEAKVKSAQATRAESNAQLARAKADIGVAEANLRVARAEERRVAALVDYAKLRAPFAGVVTWRKVDPGHLLQAGTSGKGEPIFVVSRVDPVRIFVDVPENDAVLVADGTPASVRVQALKGEEFKGKVRRSAWALDPKARTLRTEIDLPNPDGRLRPGMYAHATVTVVRQNVLTLPASAAVAQGEQAFCFLVRESKAVRTPVQIGLRDEHLVEVVKKRMPGKVGGWEDFTGQEEVVVNPLGLTDGQAVTVSGNP
jgi:RND family efflux transporter MFP subunit